VVVGAEWCCRCESSLTLGILQAATNRAVTALTNRVLAHPHVRPPLHQLGAWLPSATSFELLHGIMSLALQAGTDPIRLRWKDDINAEKSLPPINCATLIQYAKDVYRRHVKHACNTECQLSNKYNLGGIHVFRLLDSKMESHGWRDYNYRRAQQSHVNA
jgi:hypothetical protein